MATQSSKLRNQESQPDPREVKSDSPEKTVMYITRHADEWKEAAADRLVKGADWLAGATGRLSERIATVAADDHMRENAMKAVGVVTGAGAILAQQAGRIHPVQTYRATAQFARKNPKTAVVGGIVAAAALYGAYRAYRTSQEHIEQLPTGMHKPEFEY